MLSHRPKRSKRHPKSEINVVPYIDVMLVLLVIFMITTPILTAGVNVELPEVSSKPVPSQEFTPIVVQVDADKNYQIVIAGKNSENMNLNDVLDAVIRKTEAEPDAPILVAGHRDAPYNDVMELLDALNKRANVSSVSLLTQPVD